MSTPGVKDFVLPVVRRYGLPRSHEWILAGALPADARRAYSAYGRGLLVRWDLETGEAAEQWRLPSACLSAAFLPDGRLLGLAADGTAFLWDVSAGRKISEWSFGKVGGGPLLRPLGDGRRCLVVRVPSELEIRDVESGDVLRRWKSHRVTDARATPDGRRIVTRGNDAGTERLEVAVWDPDMETAVRLWDGLAGSHRGLALSADGRRVFAGWSRSGEAAVIVWDVEHAREVARWPLQGEVVGLDPSGRLVLNTYSTLEVLDPATGERVSSLRVRCDGVVGCSPDGLRLLIEDLVGLHVWDAATGVRRTLGGSVTAVATSPDGRWTLAGMRDGLLLLWSAETGERRFAAKAHEGPVRVATVLPDGLHGATGGDDGRIRIWEFETGRESAACPVRGPVVALDPGARRAVVRTKTALELVDARDGHAIAWREIGSSPGIAAFSPDGSTVLVGGAGGMMESWDSENGWRRDFQTDDGPRYSCAAFSPDGSRAVLGAQTRLHVFDFERRSLDDVAFQNPGSALRAVTFAAGRHGILYLSDDGLLGLTDLDRGVTSILETRSDVTSLAASGDTVAFGYRDSTVKLCRLDEADLAAASVRQRVRDRLRAADYPRLYKTLGRSMGDALELAEEALRSDPGNLDALMLRVDFRMGRGELDAVIADCTEALRLDPGRVDFLRLRAIAHHDRENYAACMNDATEILRQDPRCAYAYYVRGRARFDLKDLNGAIADFDNAIGIDPRDADAYNNRGVARQAQGDLPAAIADFDKAIEIDPRCAYAYYNRGNARQAQGNLPAAIADFDKAIEIDPRCAYAYLNRGNARSAQGDLPAAIADFDKAIEIDPRCAYACNNRGNERRAQGDLPAAIADFDKAIEIDPRRASTYYNRGNARQAQGDLPAAIADYDKAIEIDPRFADAYHNRGVARQAQGDLPAAIADYTKAIEIDPRDAGAYGGRGNARKAQGDIPGAIADFDKAIEINPKDANAYRSRGYMHYDRRSWADALCDFRKTLELSAAKEDYPRLRFWLIRARLGECEAATRDLAQYLKERNSGGSDDWYSRIAGFLTGRISESDFLNAAESTDEKTDRERKCEAWFYAGTRRLIDGERDKAKEYFQKCLDTGVKTFCEHASAEAELRALERG
ncbi:MAG: tetratricopeptide repeat protein [Planctomycetes bacterium]|nr:tetratricopeptide repeat protein [Planctomycetota bacterium]